MGKATPEDVLTILEREVSLTADIQFDFRTSLRDGAGLDSLDLSLFLLAVQEQSGHLRGSFFWSGSTMDGRVAGWNGQGGRLYCTVFALLAMEQNFSRLKLSKIGE